MTWLTKIIIRCAGQILKRRNNILPLTNEVLSNLTTVTNHTDHDEAIHLKKLPLLSLLEEFMECGDVVEI